MSAKGTQREHDFAIEPERDVFYRHHKGRLYQVIAFALHTETDEHLVIYRNLDGATFARPVDGVGGWKEPPSPGVNRFERFRMPR